MSVIHREHPADSPQPVRSAVLEDILRDAACFASEDEAPQGLAYRALARQIATQNADGNLLPVRASRKRSVVLWFGGLSAGTLTGAAAAILAIAHLNGSAFQITPETAALPMPNVQLNGTKSPVSDAGRTSLKNIPSPLQRTVVAAVPTTSRQTVPAPERRLAEREISSRTIGGFRRKETAPLAAPRSRSIASHTSSTATASADSAVARWKTEPFEETEYQLVTAAYAPEPASGGYAGGSDHLPLTPLKMQASYDPSESEPMAGPSLPQY